MSKFSPRLLLCNGREAHEKYAHFQSSPRRANTNFFPVFFFHSRNGLRRKGGTARNLGLAECLNILHTETSSSN